MFTLTTLNPTGCSTFPTPGAISQLCNKCFAFKSKVVSWKNRNHLKKSEHQPTREVLQDFQQVFAACTFPGYFKRESMTTGKVRPAIPFTLFCFPQIIACSPYRPAAPVVITIFSNIQIPFKSTSNPYGFLKPQQRLRVLTFGDWHKQNSPLIICPGFEGVP